MDADAGYRQLRFARPPGSTDVILVRHGETEEARPDSRFALVAGQGDPSLHPRGQAQALAVAERLAGEDVAAIYISTMRRTAETAAPLAQRLGLEPVVDADLREVHLGSWEGGVYRSKVAEGDPLVRRIVEEQRWDVIPGAEPSSEFSAWVRAGFERAAASHPDRVVVIFTHGGVIGEVMAQSSSAAPLAFMAADNGSISHVVIGPGFRVVRRFNDTTHLGTPMSSLIATSR